MLPLPNSLIVPKKEFCSLFWKKSKILSRIISGSLSCSTSSHSISWFYAFFHLSRFAIGPVNVLSIRVFSLYFEKICRHLCQFLGSFCISGFVMYLGSIHSQIFLRIRLYLSLFRFHVLHQVSLWFPCRVVSSMVWRVFLFKLYSTLW